MQKKGKDLEAWLAKPDPTVSVVLIYGGDRGLVSERATYLAKAAGFDTADPFSVVRLATEDVDRDPGRLSDELRTVPMFADRRLVWLKGGTPGKGATDAVRLMAEQPVPSAMLLVEAGELRKGAPLRSLAEGSSNVMVVPCYADEGRSLDQLIDEVLGAAGLSISLDARQALKRNLGGDRLASRGEVEKLALYAQGSQRIEVADVEALSGDASALSVDAAIDAALLGKVEALDLVFAKVAAANQVTALVIGALRQFQTLMLLRESVERDGKSAASAVASARPPIFFARRDAIEEAVARWPLASIGRALERLQSITLLSRERAALAVPIVRQTFLALAVDAARRRN